MKRIHFHPICFRLVFCFASVALFTSTESEAQVSLLSGIPYQGLIRGADGVPLANATGQMAFSLWTSTDSMVWADTVSVVSDDYGLVSARVGEAQALEDLPWQLALQLQTALDLGNGFDFLTAEPMGFVPVASWAANGFYEQSPQDYRLGFTVDTVRFHADSLIVIGDTDVPNVLTRVVRLQAQEDVIFSGRDDVVAFADDQIKLNAFTDVLLNASDDVRLEALDDVRGTASNELEMVGLRRTNIGTAAGITPTSDTTTVMGDLFLNLGMPVFPPLTGTPSDTIYLANQLNLGGEAIDVFGPTTFHNPAGGQDPVLPQHFVTLSYLNAAMFNLIEQVNALQLQIESLQANPASDD